MQFFTAEQLRHAPGSFTPSAFVQSVTGVDNVCERAAVLAAGGPLVFPKFARTGVTFALAARPSPRIGGGSMSDRYEFEMDEWDMDRPENVVYVVGLGPGDVFYLTQEAQSALEHADAICGYKLYIDLIEPEFPCEEYYATGMTKEIDRCRWALETARAASGWRWSAPATPGVYGMASPLLELAEDYPDVTVEVVPGLTAALSGGAVLGAPLAHDFCVISLSDRLTPWEVIEKRLACAAQGDFCLALYNPSSKGRPDYLQKAVRILRANGKAGDGLRHRAQHWPGGAEPRLLTLAELENTAVDMFTTVFIGNAATRQLAGRMVTPRGYRGV